MAVILLNMIDRYHMALDGWISLIERMPTSFLMLMLELLRGGKRTSHRSKSLYHETKTDEKYPPHHPFFQSPPERKISY